MFTELDENRKELTIETPAEHTGPPKGGGAKMVLVMGLVGLISSVLLVGTYQLTLPYIEANRQEALERAIFDVIPGATSQQLFELSGERVYAGYDGGGELMGIAIEGSGQGFQDVLGLIFGYSPACECVVGMKVLESKETPGLGDKIEKDPAFLENLSALDVRLNDDRTALAHPVELVKRGDGTEPWHLEAISGATISSRAVAKIIDRHAGRVIPIVEQNMDQLREGAP